MDTFTFTGVVVKEDQGYSAVCLELEVASQGDTVAEAKTMLLEAAALHLEGAFEDGLPYLRPVPPEDDPRRAAPEQVVETFNFKVSVAVRAYA
jgi:predicted RNase H-like HicB family nuclease